MAIIFVSPKKKQVTLLIMIIGFFAIALIAIFLIIFLLKPEAVLQDNVFQKPNIKIDFAVLDSDQLKSLVQLSQIEYQFIYSAVTELGKEVTGKVVAISIEQAEEKLKSDKLVNIKLELEKSGRENPFNVYYETTTTKSTKTK
jgi:hypothetical protein